MGKKALVQAWFKVVRLLFVSGFVGRDPSNSLLQSVHVKMAPLRTIFTLLFSLGVVSGFAPNKQAASLKSR
jgi:hypothetical protein